VSAVPAVVAAEPGVRSYLDLPSYAGRAAPHLR
jgi:2,4-diaminopentanoate dehydrogenase